MLLLCLQTDKPKEAELTICRREDVQRILGISSGGDAALTAIAQLAGGDYDTTGVENVGEVLALAAVRYLLRDCQVSHGGREGKREGVREGGV